MEKRNPFHIIIRYLANLKIAKYRMIFWKANLIFYSALELTEIWTGCLGKLDAEIRVEGKCMLAWSMRVSRLVSEVWFWFFLQIQCRLNLTIIFLNFVTIKNILMGGRTSGHSHTAFGITLMVEFWHCWHRMPCKYFIGTT